MTAAAIAAQYRRFAAVEARGRSPLYEALAEGVAADAALLAALGTLPPAKRQPNLFFAAFRHLFGVPADVPAFRAQALNAFPAVAAVMLARATQTNEPGRCAVLLPVLAALPQPLALFEVGASAGLCLLPDQYGYDYGASGRIAAPSPDAPVFPCAADAATPVPRALPRIAWRGGLDLNPLDVANPDETAWLETLIWPEQRARLVRLHAALRIAARERPPVARGDLRHDLVASLAAAPAGTTRVVFHTAVLTYLVPEDRIAFAAAARRHADAWIANEAPAVLPEVAARAGTPPSPGHFLLSCNGNPVAWTDPHGGAINWIDP